MSADDSVAIILICLVLFGIYSCNKNPEDTEEYKKGYEIGIADGYDQGKKSGYHQGYDEGKEEGKEEGKTDKCNDVMNFSYSIYQALSSYNICE